MLLVACILLATTIIPAGAVKQTSRRVLAEGSSDPATIDSQDAIDLKPAFHITGESGWINDPGGLFEHDGYLHVFPQANPAAPIWAAPNWGHVVSKDRVHYQRVRAACVADTEYDINGCWTGSCFLDELGSPMCWYTAASGDATLGYNYQNIAQLSALNGSDPLLEYWVKPSFNPLNPPLASGASNGQFRDPLSPWQEDDKWFMAIGGADYCAGSQFLYSTTNLSDATFEYEAILADQYSIGQVNGTCPALSVENADGTYCDQFGATCRVWECTDYFQLGSGIYVLKWSDQDLSRRMYAVDHYLISDVAPNFSESTLSSVNISSADYGLFVDSYQGGAGTVRTLDWGTIYASKSWEDALGRRLILGWAYETALGCTEQCSAGTNFTDALGYQGSHHLVRQISYNNATGALIQLPIPEYSGLVNFSLYDSLVPFDESNTVSLPLAGLSSPISASAVALNSSDAILQSDLQANFSLIANGTANTPFYVGALLYFSNASYLTVYINGSINNASVSQAAVWVDTSNLTDTMTNTSYQLGGSIPLPSTGINANNLELRFVVDRSHMEVYALGGRSVGTFKIYPNNISAGGWTMGLFASSAGSTVSAVATLDAWTSCWIEDATATEPVLVQTAFSSFATLAAQAYAATG